MSGVSVHSNEYVRCHCTLQQICPVSLYTLINMFGVSVHSHKYVRCLCTLQQIGVYTGSYNVRTLTQSINLYLLRLWRMFCPVYRECFVPSIENVLSRLQRMFCSVYRECFVASIENVLSRLWRMFCPVYGESFVPSMENVLSRLYRMFYRVYGECFVPSIENVLSRLWRMFCPVYGECFVPSMENVLSRLWKMLEDFYLIQRRSFSVYFIIFNVLLTICLISLFYLHELVQMQLIYGVKRVNFHLISKKVQFCCDKNILPSENQSLTT